MRSGCLPCCLSLDLVRRNMSRGPTFVKTHGPLKYLVVTLTNIGRYVFIAGRPSVLPAALRLFCAQYQILCLRRQNAYVIFVTLQLSSQGEDPIVNPWVEDITPWKVYNFGRSTTADCRPISIFLQSSKLLTTTALVFPSLIWKTECLYCRHHFYSVVSTDSKDVALVIWSSHFADSSMVLAQLKQMSNDRPRIRNFVDAFDLGNVGLSRQLDLVVSETSPTSVQGVHLYIHRRAATAG